MVEAVRASDFVVLVTEPTPFGLHDLKLAAVTSRLLKLPFGIVINRAGIGNRDVYNYARYEKVEISAEIPDDRKAAPMYSGGTGKTSIAVSFVALAKDCVIVDADVDASDQHLLLHPEVKSAERFFAGEVAVIEPKLCDRGKKCEPYCRYGAIIFDSEKGFL